MAHLQVGIRILLERRFADQEICTREPCILTILKDVGPALSYRPNPPCLDQLRVHAYAFPLEDDAALEQIPYLQFAANLPRVCARSL